MRRQTKQFHVFWRTVDNIQKTHLATKPDLQIARDYCMAASAADHDHIYVVFREYMGGGLDTVSNYYKGQATLEAFDTRV